MIFKNVLHGIIGLDGVNVYVIIRHVFYIRTCENTNAFSMGIYITFYCMTNMISEN